MREVTNNPMNVGRGPSTRRTTTDHTAAVVASRTAPQQLAGLPRLPFGSRLFKCRAPIGDARRQALSRGNQVSPTFW
jgi:hypothetical protein